MLMLVLMLMLMLMYVCNGALCYVMYCYVM